MADKIKIGVCLDHDYYLIGGRRFQCDYVNNDYSTYKEMTEAIENKDKAKAAQNRKKLCLSAIDDEGVRREIAGVHAGHGELILKPKFVKYQTVTLYPYVDWIEAALAERIGLEKQVAFLNAILHEFKLEPKSGYSFNPDQHPGEVDRVEKDFNDKMKAAKKTSLKEQREKTPEPKKRQLRF